MEVHLLGQAGSVHEGLMGAATFVHCNTAQALERAGRDHPGLPLLITGHSMGGARQGQGAGRCQHTGRALQLQHTEPPRAANMVADAASHLLVVCMPLSSSALITFTVSCSGLAWKHHTAQLHSTQLQGVACAGSVASVLAALLQDRGAPPGLGPVSCLAIGPAPVLSANLADACNSFVTSLVLGYAMIQFMLDSDPM